MAARHSTGDAGEPGAAPRGAQPGAAAPHSSGIPLQRVSMGGKKKGEEVKVEIKAAFTYCF